MNEARRRKRELFLARMSKEAVAVYVDRYGQWEEAEREYLPFFLSQVGNNKNILDLAGGYAKATSLLQENGNSVVLADMSLDSIKGGMKKLAPGEVQFIRLDMNVELPFIDGAFDGIWFAQAFEYVPPDGRDRFLRSLRRSVKTGGVVFFSAEGLTNTRVRLSYFRGYLYWKLVRRAPIVWGENIYMLDLPKYKGWHYHSLVFNKRFEKQLREAGFEILKSKDPGEGDYYTYVLKAV